MRDFKTELELVQKWMDKNELSPSVRTLTTIVSELVNEVNKLQQLLNKDNT